MFCGQRLYAFPHQDGLFAQLGGLVWQRMVISQIFKAVAELVLCAPGECGKWRGTLLPDRVSVTIEQDRAEPGEKLATPVVTAQALPRFNQGVLRQVFGQG